MSLPAWSSIPATWSNWVKKRGALNVCAECIAITVGTERGLCIWLWLSALSLHISKYDSSHFRRHKMELNWMKRQPFKWAAASCNLLNYFQKGKSEHWYINIPHIQRQKNTRSTIPPQSISICLTEQCPWITYHKSIVLWEITALDFDEFDSKT